MTDLAHLALSAIISALGAALVSWAVARPDRARAEAQADAQAARASRDEWAAALGVQRDRCDQADRRVSELAAQVGRLEERVTSHEREQATDRVAVRAMRDELLAALQAMRAEIAETFREIREDIREARRA